MPGTLNSQGQGGARSIRRLSLSTVVALEISERLTGPEGRVMSPTEAGAQLAVGRMTGRLKRQSFRAWSEAHLSVRDVQLGNRNVDGSLLEDKAVR